MYRSEIDCYAFSSASVSAILFIFWHLVNFCLIYRIFHHVNIGLTIVIFHSTFTFLIGVAVFILWFLSWPKDHTVHKQSLQACKLSHTAVSKHKSLPCHSAQCRGVTILHSSTITPDLYTAPQANTLVIPWHHKHPATMANRSVIPWLPELYQNTTRCCL